MRKVSSFFVIVLFSYLLLGCSVFQQTPSWSQLTPQGKAAFALSVYNTEYDNYVRLAKGPNLTDEAKQVLRIKKKILVQMKPVLDSYTLYVRTNQIPPKEVETKLLALLNQLIAQQSKK